MKKLVCIISACLLIMSILCGCGNQEEASSYVYYADSDYMSDLSQGLVARWKFIDEFEQQHVVESLDNDATASYYSDCVNKELDIISRYTDEKFQDSKLKEKAIAYNNVLLDQLDAVKYINADYQKYLDKWNSTYNERAKLLKVFVDDFGLEVDEKYQDQLDDLISTADSVIEDENQEAEINALVENINFELTENSYGLKTYSATIENTTNIDFENLDVSINLIDADGVIVEEQYAGVSNFKQGQKAKLEFYTQKDFVKTDTTVSFWS